MPVHHDVNCNAIRCAYCALRAVHSTTWPVPCWNTKYRCGRRRCGVFSRHHAAAAGCFWPRASMARRVSTRKPDSRLSLPVTHAARQEKNPRGPDSTSAVRKEAADACCCANGKARPTHSARTHRGASPGGTDVMSRTLFMVRGRKVPENARDRQARPPPRTRSAVQTSGSSPPASARSPAWTVSAQARACGSIWSA